MKPPDLPEEFVARLKAVKAKRAKTVIDHILEHGFITNEELRDRYGYHHPPRAARDVREQGIPLETFRIADESGRKIAGYRFGDPRKARYAVLAGRQIFSKRFKDALIESTRSKCNICLGEREARYLQVDHRVPYEVVGDAAFSEEDHAEYMLLCGPCNRAKSWSCEHCENWRNARVPALCQSCYWGSPEKYVHIALRQERRLDAVWTGEESAIFDKLRSMADAESEPMPQYVKKVLAKAVATRY